MHKSTLAAFACAMIVLAGCGGSNSASSSSPLGWLGGSKEETLTPDGGYPDPGSDGRPLLASVTGARWEPLNDGKLLVVTGLGNTKGWWDVQLVTEVPVPTGRIRPDENGVLRLRLVGVPPRPNTFEAANPPNPASDTITVGMPLSFNALRNLREVVITGAGNSVTLRQ